MQEGLRSPEVRELAVGYCRAAVVPSHDELGELNAVFQGVLNDFAFRKDTVGAELLQPVAGILRTRAGDCDDLNMILLPSLVGSIGYPARAVTVKTDQDRPNEFSHVYCEAQVSNGQWVALDVARSNPAFGKSPEYYWARENWPLTPGASANADLNGYGRHAMKRRFGMGAQTLILVKRHGFPRRRGLGQDDGDGGITDAEYASDQADYAANTPAVASTPINYTPEIQAGITALPSILTGVAQVVKASNTPGIAVSGVVSGASANSLVSGTGLGVTASSPILVLGLLVVVGLFAISKKG